MNGASDATQFLELLDGLACGERRSALYGPSALELIGRVAPRCVPQRPGVMSWLLLDLLDAVPRGRYRSQVDASFDELAGRLRDLHDLHPDDARRALFVAASLGHLWPQMQRLAARTGYADARPHLWHAQGIPDSFNLRDAHDAVTALTGALPRAGDGSRRGRRDKLSQEEVDARCDALAATDRVVVRGRISRSYRPVAIAALGPFPHRVTYAAREGRNFLAAVPEATAVAAGWSSVPLPTGDADLLLETVATLTTTGTWRLPDAVAAAHALCAA